VVEPMFNPTWAKGIDVSQFQKEIDWGRVEKSGLVDFSIIRAGAGVTIQDPYFARNYAAVKSLGIPFGTYWFLYPKTSSPEEEAEAYVKSVEAAGGWNGWRPMSDIEQEGAGDLGVDQLTDWMHRHLTHLETLAGAKPVIYSNPSFLKERLRSNEFAEYELWISHYGVAHPTIPAPWKAARLWQHTSCGSVPGIDGRVDLDVFFGTLDELKQWCTVGAPSLASRGGNVPRQTTPTLSDHRILYFGASGDDVRLCQCLLYRAGQHPGAVDGRYGPNTMAALRSFQTTAHIKVDGVCGPDTWAHLEKAKQASRPLIVRGDRGQQVTDLQYLLDHHGAKPEKVDGLFGPNTEAAVQRFQRSSQLTVDGEVGPQTWGALL
jgi:GH25 family lysozyme M1 (1,4-beta-N-acetylmuramidase)